MLIKHNIQLPMSKEKQMILKPSVCFLCLCDSAFYFKLLFMDGF